jgi:hypothetical protein
MIQSYMIISDDIRLYPVISHHMAPYPITSTQNPYIHWLKLAKLKFLMVKAHFFLFF